MDFFEILKSISIREGVSGQIEICEYFENILKEYCHETITDKIGNVIGVIKSKKENPKRMMVEAHMDRIGLIVKNVDENGFISFDTVGGVDKRILLSQEVIICGKEKVFGVIGAKPPHLREKKDNDSACEIKDMLIDVGMKCDMVKEKVSVGDYIMLPCEPVKLLNDRAAGAAFDNRAGITSLVGFLEMAKDIDFPYDVYVVFTAGEESGLLGAYSAAFNIKPDISVSVDVTFGTFGSEDTAGTFEPGCGAVIFRGPDTSYEGTKRLIKIAEDRNIPYEIEAASSSGTNASAIQNARGSVETYLLSIPLKYMHETVELLCLDDVLAVSRLILEIAKGGVSLA